MAINWFPGHMLTARREVEEGIGQVDVVIEVLDASGRAIARGIALIDSVVLAEVKGPVATYTLKGNEIYVRAKVISSKPHPNPSQRGDVESAWVQPVVPGAR